MKLTFALIGLCLASLSFAETCYQSETKIPFYYKLPEVICVQSAELVFMNPGLPVIPHFEAFVETSVGRLTNLNVTFSGVAPYKVTTERLIVEDGYPQGCGDINNSTLIVDFDVDSKGVKLDRTPRVSVRNERNNDVCHSDGETTIFKYYKI